MPSWIRCSIVYAISLTKEEWLPAAPMRRCMAIASSCSIKRQCQSVVSKCSHALMQPHGQSLSTWPVSYSLIHALAYALVVKQHHENSSLSIFLTHKCKCVELFPYESACLALSLLVFGSCIHKLILLHRLPSLLRCCSCSSITLVLD